MKYLNCIAVCLASLPSIPSYNYIFGQELPIFKEILVIDDVGHSKVL